MRIYSPHLVFFSAHAFVQQTGAASARFAQTGVGEYHPINIERGTIAATTKGLAYFFQIFQLKKDRRIDGIGGLRIFNLRVVHIQPIPVIIFIKHALNLCVALRVYHNFGVSINLNLCSHLLRETRGRTI